MISLKSLLALFAAALMIAPGANAVAQDESQAASALRARYAQLQPRLTDNPFGKPLAMDSSETSSNVTGDIYAVVNHPFKTASSALNGASRWCDIMMLHLNTKYCRASGSALQLNIGKKFDEPVEDTFRMDFDYRVVAATPGYLKIVMSSGEGPFSTRDYRVVLEAIPLEGNTTFLHFTYTYAFGISGRVAMQTYLGTAGSKKVGFTTNGKSGDGQPAYIGGMRGLVERNTMRYYLAIESFLGALSAPPVERTEKSLRDWFAATERYPRQLRELNENEYLAVKRKEYQRLNTARSG